MKKGLVIMLAVAVMLVTMLPASAFAANTSQAGANSSGIIIGPGDPISAIDFAVMKKYLLSGGKEGYFKPEWDVNKDGVFDAIDYALIKKMILGGI